MHHKRKPTHMRNMRFFLNDKLQVDIKPDDISVCHTMRASRRQPGNVIVKFTSLIKDNDLKEGKAVKRYKHLSE